MTCGVSGVRLECINGKTLALVVGDFVADHLGIVDIPYARFRKSSIVEAGSSQRLTKSPPRVRFRRQGIDRIIESVQYTFSQSDRIFFGADHDACMNAHTLVPSPAHHTAGSQGASFIQSLLDSLPGLLGLYGMKLVKSDRSAVILLIEERNQHDFYSSRRRIRPESGPGIRASLAHGSEPLRQQFEIAGRYCALQGMQFLWAAE